MAHMAALSAAKARDMAAMAAMSAMAASATPISHEEELARQRDNTKVQLGTLLQRITGKSLDKNDIVYEVQKHGNQYQCSVTMASVASTQVFGELRVSAKEAEQDAASHAIRTFEGEIQGMGHSIAERVSDIPISVHQAAVAAGIITMEENPSETLTHPDIKSLLHSIIAKVVNRRLEKGDIDYSFESTATPGMFNATLTLPCMPGSLGTQRWVGSNSPFKKDSMFECALGALDSMLTHPVCANMVLAGIVNVRSVEDKRLKHRKDKAAKQAKRTPQPPGGNGGKGKGKGKKGMGKFSGGKGDGNDTFRGMNSGFPQQSMSMPSSAAFSFPSGFQNMPSGMVAVPHSMGLGQVSNFNSARSRSPRSGLPRGMGHF